MAKPPQAQVNFYKPSKSSIKQFDVLPEISAFDNRTVVVDKFGRELPLYGIRPKKSDKIGYFQQIQSMQSQPLDRVSLSSRYSSLKVESKYFNFLEPDPENQETVLNLAIMSYNSYFMPNETTYKTGVDPFHDVMKTSLSLGTSRPIMLG